MPHYTPQSLPSRLGGEGTPGREGMENRLQQFHGDRVENGVCVKVTCSAISPNTFFSNIAGKLLKFNYKAFFEDYAQLANQRIYNLKRLKVFSNRFFFPGKQVSMNLFPLLSLSASMHTAPSPLHITPVTQACQFFPLVVSQIC